MREAGGPVLVRRWLKIETYRNMCGIAVATLRFLKTVLFCQQGSRMDRAVWGARTSRTRVVSRRPSLLDAMSIPGYPGTQ
eukprot:2923680-Rhodomonas_salina.2